MHDEPSNHDLPVSGPDTEESVEVASESVESESPESGSPESGSPESRSSELQSPEPESAPIEGPELERVVDPDDPAEIARKNAELLERHRRKHKGLLPEAWSIKLPSFEGPLDLLLHLVRIDEVEISEIPVALICDQYHAYLELMEELDLDIAGDYIYEAALLIQLKARMLLPRPKVEEGEEPEDDPREELVRRLLEYRPSQRCCADPGRGG